MSNQPKKRGFFSKLFRTEITVKNKKYDIAWLWIIGAFLMAAGVVLFQTTGPGTGPQQIEAVPVADEVEHATQSTQTFGRYMEAQIIPANELIAAINRYDEGTYAAAAVNEQTHVFAVGNENKVLKATYLDAQTPAIFQALDSKNISTQSIPKLNSGAPRAGTTNSLNPVSIIMILLLTVLIAGPLVALLAARRSARRSMAEQSGTTKQRNGRSDEVTQIPEVTFKDVAGADEAVEELSEIVDFLKNPEAFEKVGAKAAKGALLVGPPGTGKTLLARAVAGECGIPFYSVAGSDFVETFVGVGAKRVRELFDKANAHPEGAIIFIDEIDAIGRKRSGGEGAGNSEVESTLNALLVELDGFEKSNTVVLAATNRADILDDALLRPGRLERKVQVPLPDRLGRYKILKTHSYQKPVDRAVDLDLIARRIPGMSGAECAAIVNEACCQAAREGVEIVTIEHFDHAIATTAMGKARKSAIVTEHDRQVTAWHEAGHTVAAMVLPDADDPASVSIIPRGPAGGVTWMVGSDDLFLTRKQAMAKLVVAMAGRAGEERFLNGEFTSGPYGDLQSATNVALAMVTQYGMTDVGLMIRSDGLLSTGSKVTDETVEEVERLLAQGLEMARQVLQDNSGLFLAIVKGLLDNDTLYVADLQKLKETYQQHPVDMPALTSKPAPPNRTVPAEVTQTKTAVTYHTTNTSPLKNKLKALFVRKNKQKPKPAGAA